MKEAARFMVTNYEMSDREKLSKEECDLILILAQAGYPVAVNHFCPQETGFWKNEIIVYAKDKEPYTKNFTKKG